MKSQTSFDYFKFKLKYFLKYLLLNRIKKTRTNEYIQFKDTRKFIVMQTPTHGNLGDQAIAYAQKEFVKDNFKDYEYVEIPLEKVTADYKKIKKVLTEEDIIGIHGGGNMGDMYLLEEYIRRFIIKKFKDNLIISFPQTLSFSNTIIGQKELKKTVKTYNKNSNLIIVARELQSYNLMKKYFVSKKVIHTPDIVLYLNQYQIKARKGVITCFRSDQEKSIDDSLKERLIDYLSKNFKDIYHTDTVVKRKIYPENRLKELKKIWSEFSSAELVVTDRLHGMIFCVITNTPCIVFGNFNHKIESTYNKWLKNIKFIAFVKNNEIKDENEFKTLVGNLVKNSQEFQRHDMTQHYHKIIESLS